MELQDLVRWQRDWFDVGSEEALERRGDYYRAQKRGWKERISRELFAVRDGWERYVEKFAFGLRDSLRWDPNLSSTPSVLRLLDIAREASGGDEPDARVWFECLFLIDQAIGQALIEYEDPRTKIGADLDKFIQLLAEGLFDGPSERITVYSYHDADPKAHFMVVSDGIGIEKPFHRPGCIERLNRIRCRRLKGGGEWVHYYDRPKHPFSAFLKMMKQLTRGDDDWTVVTDRAGVTLVTEDVDTVHQLYFMIKEIVESTGGRQVTDLESNLLFEVPTDEVEIEEIEGLLSQAADTSNEESSKDFKVAKFDVEWHGRTYEIQLLTFADHYCGKLATSDVGHDMYKLKQARKYHLKLRFPYQIYRYNWVGDRVGAILEGRQQTKLGWCVHEPHKEIP